MTSTPNMLPPQRYTPGNHIPKRSIFELQWQAVGSEGSFVSDPLMYAPIKRFGNFIINLRGFGHTRKEKGTYPPKDPRDCYISLSLPARQPNPVTRESVTASLSLLASFIEAHSLTPDRIKGTTYERLGRVARLYGFRLTYPEPKGLLNRMDWAFAGWQGRMTAKMGGLKGNPGRPVIVTQKLRPFLQRYGSNTTDA